MQLTQNLHDMFRPAQKRDGEVSHRCAKPWGGVLRSYERSSRNSHAVFALLVVSSGSSLAGNTPIEQTKVGSPIWRPCDFQLFTALAAPFPDAFFGTFDMLLTDNVPGQAMRISQLVGGVRPHFSEPMSIERDERSALLAGNVADRENTCLERPSHP